MSGYAVAHVEPAGGSKPQASRLVAALIMIALVAQRALTTTSRYHTTL
jgi:hypothetical protein